MLDDLQEKQRTLSVEIAKKKGSNKRKLTSDEVSFLKSLAKEDIFKQDNRDFLLKNFVNFIMLMNENIKICFIPIRKHAVAYYHDGNDNRTASWFQ